jgi:hypothetical protein
MDTPDVEGEIRFEDVSVSFAPLDETSVADRFTATGPSSLVTIGATTLPCEEAVYSPGQNQLTIASCTSTSKTLLAAASIIVPVDVAEYTVTM